MYIRRSVTISEIHDIYMAAVVVFKVICTHGSYQVNRNLMLIHMHIYTVPTQIGLYMF